MHVDLNNTDPSPLAVPAPHAADTPGIHADVNAATHGTSIASDGDALTDATTDQEPYFPDEAAFLQAVFDNWRYFARVLGAKYSSLVEQERESGNNAPVHARCHLPIDAPPLENRKFDIAIGSCDAEEIIMDAITRCTKPENKSFYAKFTPIRKGQQVGFRTWFVSHLRSIAGSRIRAWKRRWGYEQPPHDPDHVPQETDHVPQETDETVMRVDTYMRRYRDTTSGLDMTIEAAAQAQIQLRTEETVSAFLARGGRIRRCPARSASNVRTALDAARAADLAQWRMDTRVDRKPSERKDPGYHPDFRSVEMRHDLQKLTDALTHEERTILDTYLDADDGKAFAHAIGAEYNKARSKISYIKKKMRKRIKRV